MPQNSRILQIFCESQEGSERPKREFYRNTETETSTWNYQIFCFCFCRKYFFLQKQLVSAERACFCRKSLFLPNWETDYYQEMWNWVVFNQQKGSNFCRNKLFLQKQAVSAERSTFCRNTERAQKDRNVSAESFCHYSAETICRNVFRSFTGSNHLQLADTDNNWQ